VLSVFFSLCSTGKQCSKKEYGDNDIFHFPDFEKQRYQNRSEKLLNEKRVFAANIEEMYV
jgi:hypothetical protein